MNVYLRVSVPDDADPDEFVAARVGGADYHRLPQNPDLLSAAERARELLQPLVDDPNVIRGALPKQDAREALNTLNAALGWPSELH